MGTDRFEQADRTFFERVERGYQSLAQKYPDRIHSINADLSMDSVEAKIWESVSTALNRSE